MSSAPILNEPAGEAQHAIVTSARAPLHARIAFVVETARRLHQYGTAAPRLESAVDKLAGRLGLCAQVWSSPTAIIISFAEVGDHRRVAETTQVIRLSPGDIDLRHLVEVNEIADKVIAGELDIGQGSHLLQTLSDRIGRRARAREVLCFGLVSATLAVLMRGAWSDVVAAGCIGLIVGTLADVAARSQRMRLALEALSALIATVLATQISLYITPLTLKVTVLASLRPALRATRVDPVITLREL